MIFLYQGKDAISHKVLGKLLQDLDEGEYIITIKKNRPIRSLQANRYYHALVNIYAIHTGHTHDEIIHMFKLARWWTEVVYPSGEVQRIPKTTHDRDTLEFASMVNNFKEWGKEEFPEVKVVEQADMDHHRWLAIEMEYEKVHSGF